MVRVSKHNPPRFERVGRLCGCYIAVPFALLITHMPQRFRAVLDQVLGVVGSTFSYAAFFGTFFNVFKAEWHCQLAFAETMVCGYSQTRAVNFNRVVGHCIFSDLDQCFHKCGIP